MLDYRWVCVASILGSRDAATWLEWVRVLLGPPGPGGPAPPPCSAACGCPEWSLASRRFWAWRHTSSTTCLLVAPPLWVPQWPGWLPCSWWVSSWRYKPRVANHQGGWQPGVGAHMAAAVTRRDETIKHADDRLFCAAAVAPWQEFIGDITDSLAEFMNKIADKKTNGRRLSAKDDTLLTDAKDFFADVLSGLATKTEKLVDSAAEIGDKIRYKYTDGNNHAILSDILGADYGKYFPKNITLDALAKVGAGDAYTGLMQKLADADSFEQAYELLDKAAYDSNLCTEESFEPSEKVPTECVGPSVVLDLEPKACVIDSKTHTIDCLPARLVLKKIPGYCTFKHHTPFTWTGKECKLEKTFGHGKEITKGGEEYQPAIFHEKKSKV